MKNTNFEILEKDQMNAITGGKWVEWIIIDDEDALNSDSSNTGDSAMTGEFNGGDDE